LLIGTGSIESDRRVRNFEYLGFIEELDRRCRPLGWIFRQDGAPAHISSSTMEWLEDRLNVIVDWPANSPD
jgi:hypothetical protein